MLQFTYVKLFFKFEGIGMKTRTILFLFVFFSGMSLLTQSEPEQPKAYQAQIATWAQDHPFTYNTIYLHAQLGMSVAAGYLYARLFIPHLLTKQWADSCDGITQFMNDIKKPKNGLHVLSSIATTLCSFKGIRSTFLQENFDRSSEQTQLLASLSLIPTVLGMCALNRYFS